MHSLKYIYDIIKFHDNLIKLKNVFDTSNSTYDVNHNTYDNGFIYCAVSCNNYEAFIYLINHKQFNSAKINNLSWLKLIFNKYDFNSRYLDGLCKSNVKLASKYITCCESLKIFHKIFQK